MVLLFVLYPLSSAGEFTHPVPAAPTTYRHMFPTSEPRLCGPLVWTEDQRPSGILSTFNTQHFLYLDKNMICRQIYWHFQKSLDCSQGLFWPLIFSAMEKRSLNDLTKYKKKWALTLLKNLHFTHLRWMMACSRSSPNAFSESWKVKKP